MTREACSNCRHKPQVQAKALRLLFTIVLLALGAIPWFPTIGHSAEATSNGTGGGNWSDPATWRGNKVPAPADEVTIRKNDTVVFDRNDDGKTTCAKLFIDPQGALRFKSQAGKIVLVVAGPV